MSDGIPRKVLVLDGDADARASLCDILELDGFDAQSAGSLAEAAAHNGWAEVSAIILDWRLSEGGLETLLPQLRRLAPEAAVIVSAGTVGIETAVAALRLGAADYILKPIDPYALRTSLSRILEQRAMQQALRRSQDQLRLLIERVKDTAIFMLDPQGCITSWNAGAERIYLYREAEIIGKHRAIVYRPEDAALGKPLEHLRRAAAAGSFVDEGWRVRKDGSLFWGSVALTALYDVAGNVRAFATVTHDLTERKRAEETLRQERDLAETLLETAHAIVLVLDMQGHILRFNSFMEELCGYRLAEVKGQEWFETFLPRQERGRAAEGFCLGLDQSHAEGVISPLRTKDGRERQIVWWSNVLRDARGKGTAILSIGHDITALRSAQARAVQSERLAAIGEMAAGLAHEARNALQRSQSCLEMLTLEVQDRPAAIDLVQRIQKAQDHLYRLFEEVRSYAAPLPLRRKACLVDGIIDETWANVELARGAHCGALRHQRQTANTTADVDPQRIEQVFRNILDNALDAAGGRTDVDVRWSDARLAQRPALEIGIRDHGPGFTERTVARLFEPFFTTKTKGTGLGMAIVKRIVEAHGGLITAGNAESGGAEITITLPRSAE